MRRHFVFYYGGQVLTEVMESATVTTIEQARRHAIASHDRVPLSTFPDNPGDFRLKLALAECRIMEMIG